jgi:AcrR family transcriptional regulator
MRTREKARRRPSQERSAALVDAILQATAELLRTEGPERATTNRIAARAGVSIGSVYQYFPNKEALFRALGERYVAKLRAALAETWPAVVGAPPDEALGRALRGLLAPTVADPLLSGMLHLSAIPPRAFEAIGAFERDLEQMLAEVLASRPDAPPDPALSARVLVRALGGVVGRTLATEPHLVTDPRFVDELVRLARGFLE